MSTQTTRTPPRQQSAGLYAAIIIGVVAVGGFAAWSFTSGGLPGTKDSPSAVVNGEKTTGKTGGGG